MSKYFLQYSIFASERPQVRTWGRQTCFLPQATYNLVTPLCGCIAFTHAFAHKCKHAGHMHILLKWYASTSYVRTDYCTQIQIAYIKRCWLYLSKTAGQFPRAEMTEEQFCLKQLLILFGKRGPPCLCLAEKSCSSTRCEALSRKSIFLPPFLLLFKTLPR